MRGAGCPQCDNEFDDDGDTYLDYVQGGGKLLVEGDVGPGGGGGLGMGDPGCRGPRDRTETCSRGGESGCPECDNGDDDDGDTLIDYGPPGDATC